MLKIVKFGGSSLANTKQFKKVKDIINSDSSRRLVVVSAIGKVDSNDNKITDLLYLCHAHTKYNFPCDSIFKIIKDRFILIKRELNLAYDIEKDLDDLYYQLDKNIDLDYLVSKGEYFTGRLMAEYLNYHFIDAKDLIYFNYDNTFDYPKIEKKLQEILKDHPNLVIPGFYGSLPNGKLKIMSRGGCDITGSVIANAINADIYENWTDVSGIYMADPNIVNKPKRIDIINYLELRELSYMGASVLHEEAILPVKDKNIPIYILNTNKPQSKGTIIKNDINDDISINSITGIAGKKDFSIITIKKNHMSNEIGLIRKALAIFEKYFISIEHIPSGIDSFSIIVESIMINDIKYDLISELKKECKADIVTIIDNIALIATVGRTMKNIAGISGRLFSALGNKGINISVISQTSDEINIIIGVSNDDYNNTINTIYNEFNDNE